MFAFYMLSIITSCSFSSEKNDIYSGKASGVCQFSLNKMIDASHPPNHHQRPKSSTTVHRIILIVFSFDELHAYLQ